jgi:hypothetical protein
MPQAPDVLEAYGQLQRFLAQATMEAVQAAVKQPWKEVLLEITASADANRCSTKLRAFPPAAPAIDVPLTEMVALAAQEIWETRTLGITPNWRAMTLKITSEGQCNVHFDYVD